MSAEIFMSMTDVNRLRIKINFYNGEKGLALLKLSYIYLERLLNETTNRDRRK